MSVKLPNSCRRGSGTLETYTYIYNLYYTLLYFFLFFLQILTFFFFFQFFFFLDFSLFPWNSVFFFLPFRILIPFFFILIPFSWNYFFFLECWFNFGGILIFFPSFFRNSDSRFLEFWFFFLLLEFWLLFLIFFFLECWFFFFFLSEFWLLFLGIKVFFFLKFRFLFLGILILFLSLGIWIIFPRNSDFFSFFSGKFIRILKSLNSGNKVRIVRTKSASCLSKRQ